MKKLLVCSLLLSCGAGWEECTECANTGAQKDPTVVVVFTPTPTEVPVAVDAGVVVVTPDDCDCKDDREVKHRRHHRVPKGGHPCL